jgi:hypothetical protein
VAVLVAWCGLSHKWVDYLLSVELNAAITKYLIMSAVAALISCDMIDMPHV